MKRDMDLVRELLLKVEEAPADGLDEIENLKIDKFTTQEIFYHIALLKEAGLVEAHINYANDGPNSAWITRMTWNGHELLDAIRDETVWGKTKEELKKVGGSAGLEVVKQIAIQIGVQLLGRYLPLG